MRCDQRLRNVNSLKNATTQTSGYKTGQFGESVLRRTIPKLTRKSLIGPIAGKDRAWSSQKDLEVQPE